MKEITLTSRLRSVAELVRPGARLADVGTDHGYLPAYLLKNEKISFAVASDIAKEPAAKAKTHLAAWGLAEKSAVVVTPGLCGIEKYMPSDIAIAGMGGEMIVSILENASFIKNPDIHLILQPMTKQEVLRYYLCENGFEITEEKSVWEKERVYQIIACRYTGEKYKMTPVEAYFGPRLLEKMEESTVKMLEKKRIQWQKIVSGKQRGKEEAMSETELLSEIERRLQKGD